MPVELLGGEPLPSLSPGWQWWEQPWIQTVVSTLEGKIRGYGLPWWSSG